MYENLAMFRTAAQMAKHAGSRQAVVAKNIANADTPGFQATSIPKFSDAVQMQSASMMRATRPQHIGAGQLNGRASLEERHVEAAPNGNSVSIEEEMMKAVEISREHKRALTIYKHTMDVIRTSIGR